MNDESKSTEGATLLARMVQASRHHVELMERLAGCAQIPSHASGQ